MMTGSLALALALFSFSGILAQDPSSLDVPFLQQALDWLATEPGALEVLDRELGPLIPEDLEQDLQDLIDLINSTLNGTAVDRCSFCQAAGKLVVQIIPTQEWEEWRDPLVNVCYALVLSVNNNTQVDILCPGMIDMQGPAVYYVILNLNTGPLAPRPNVDSACENLNFCFPPKPNALEKHQQQKAPQTRIEHFRQKWKSLKNYLNPRMDMLQRKHRGRGKADPLIVAQMTDIHIDPIYAEGAATDCNIYVCCRDKYDGEGEAGLWGEHTCNTPQRTLNLFLQKVAEFEPDFIIYSGDTPPHSAWEESFDSQLGCTEILIDSLHKTLEDYNIYPAIGNHEMYPTNLYYVPSTATQDMSAAFAELWQPFSKFEDEQMQTMSHAGYYSILVRPGLRLISINTLYWYMFNWFNTLSEVEDDIELMYQYVHEQLQHARDNNEKVIFLGHHPPGNSDMLPAHTRRYVDAMLEYSDVIILHLAGHTHRDDFSLVTDPTDGSAKHVTFIAPSVTPKTNVNPSVRLYEVDPDTFELLNYRQYTMDLANANDNDEEPDIEFSYSAKELYDLPDLSPNSWLQLAHRFEEDDELFQIYYEKYGTHVLEGPCEEDCKANRLCHIHNPNYDEYLECMEEAGVEPQ